MGSRRSVQQQRTCSTAKRARTSEEGIAGKMSRDAKKVRYGNGMKLTDDRIPGLNLVTAYGPAEIRIGETALQASCIVTAEQLIADLKPQTIADLTVSDLEQVFSLDPEIVVIGTGPRQHFPDHSLMGAVLSRGIGCEVMDLGAACRTYNVLVSEDRRAVAVLFLN
jgi:uncharacterized protein